MRIKMKHSDQGFSLYLVIGIAGAVLLAAIATAAVLFFMQKKPTAQIPEPTPAIQASTTDDVNTGNNGNKLPGSDSGDGLGGQNPNVQSEKMTFADFYKKIDEKTEIKKKFDLPINIKTDTVNYYDVARIIDLDPSVPDLNAKGLAIINNPFSSDARNFYSTYDLLINKNIPILLTSDFMISYYQDSLKDIFEKIKSSVFYSELWQVNKTMFDIANNRYRARRAISGDMNDPALEGERLEAAYFAVALQLLKPRAEQVNAKGVENSDKFSQNDLGELNYSLPEYLSGIVNSEADLVNKGQGKTVSPVFLYIKDYGDYLVPQDMLNNARQANFTRAMKWMNSVFPLYFKGDSCPGCLLDKDDWTVSNVGAFMIAGDFAANQGAKNQWAKIYKVISFFQGLRQELSYLQYSDALTKVFGPDYKINEVFSPDRKTLDSNMSKLQAELVAYKFAPIEGGLDRNDPLARAAMGMRMLQDSYWPDNYIFDRLTYKNVGAYQGGSINKDKNKDILLNKTFCQIYNTAYRCKGIGMDVVNLVYPNLGDNPYFKENTRYNGYDNQAKLLEDQTGYFNISSWHNNGFWATLNFGKTLFYPEQLKDYFNPANWQEKNINTLLGSWVNLQVSPDKWEQRGQTDPVNDVSRGSNYIEPNLDFINEIYSSTKMLKDALTTFGAVKEGDAASVRLSELNTDFTKIRDVAIKELSVSGLDYDDSKTIQDIAEKFKVKNSEKLKSFILNFKYDKAYIQENITGVKLFALVYEQGGKKYLAVGPIFNYKEGN